MATETRASGARIALDERFLILELTWGAEFVVSLDSLPALEEAAEELLVDVRVTRAGSHIAWPGLEVEFNVSTLIHDAVTQARAGRRRRPNGLANIPTDS